MTFHNLLRFSKKEDFPARFSHRNVPNQEAGGRKVTEKPPKAEAKADAKAERDGKNGGFHHASQFMITYGYLW